MKWWDAVVNYYKMVGEKYGVDPVIFVGIHIVATPLFALTVGWLIYNTKRKKPLVLPIIISTLVFNAATIYLVIFGVNIPWFLYTILAITTLITGYFTVKKIRKKIRL